MLSRRDFLKLSGLGLISFFAPPLPLNFSFDDPFDGQQGRVTSSLLWLYDAPSYKGARTKMYWRDLILPITNVTVSDDESAYNRVWYEIGADGYAYSGNVQPVHTNLNTPRMDIPSAGILAEVSVPYTDAYEFPDKTSKMGYRMYYETTHWVMGASNNSNDGSVWYQVLDDKWKILYYAQAEHLRLFLDDELTPLSPEVSDDQKKIEVHLDRQLLVAQEYGNPVFVTRIASGAVFRNGTYTTPRGRFMTYHKRPTRHMAAGDLTSNGFDLPGVPWVMYITESGISLHGTYWHNDFGRPRSHGCINLSPVAAKWLFRWTSPVVLPGEQFEYRPKGTQVNIMN
jgi:L,D-transpeptidase catalytic domain